MELIKSVTFSNLTRAFISECAAKTRYEFIEYGARYNGKEAIATLVDKIAYQEFNHARMLYTKIQSASQKTIDNHDVCASLPFKEKWDVLENLRLAAEDEASEAIFYQKAAKTAESEGFKDIAELFELIRAAEIKHRKVFLFLYERLKDGTLYKRDKKEKWICPSCGYEYSGEECFKTCPLCEAKQETVLIPMPKEVVI